MIRIQVPATSANLGSGFDALGIALTMYNQVWMEESDTLEIDPEKGIEKEELIGWLKEVSKKEN